MTSQTHTDQQSEPSQGPVYLAIGLALGIGALMAGSGTLKAIERANAMPGMEEQIADAALPIVAN